MKFMFVYGTLMRGLPLNHYMISTMNAKFVCKAKVNGFKLYASGIPFLVRDYENKNVVYGEVWAVDDEDWDRGITIVDIVESGYRREKVEAIGNKEFLIVVLMYIHILVLGLDE
jgi:gamma-glutamylcyclotransferase (GGCT)/AIG2-like uncharacterized protein YtfP